MSRRELLKAMGVGSAGVVLAACAPQATPTAAPVATQAPAAQDTATSAPEATKPPEPTATAPKKAAVKVTLVESWFGVPQYQESLDPVNAAINDAMSKAGVAVEINSMILADHENKYPLLYASGADFTMAFDAPWYKMDTLRSQNALIDIAAKVNAAKSLKGEITDKIINANLIDSKLFGIPAAYYYAGTGGMIFRQDLAEKYKVTMPDTKGGWASLEPFLDAILKNEKGMIPFANVTTQSLTGYSRAHHAWGANGPSKTGVGILDYTKEFKFADSEEDTFWLDQVKILRSWWEKGYINKTDLNFSGSSQNAQVDYIYPGKAAACVENEPNYKWVDESKQMQASNKDAKLFGVETTGATAGMGKGIGQLKQWNFIVFNANAPAEQVDAGIAYYDWLASNQDNMDMWFMGVDGTNYKKEDSLRFSEIAGTDASRNYRRQWYVSGLSGRFQRQPKDLPQSAVDALTFFSTESNWDFVPYEAFQPDLKALEVDTGKLNAVYDEAVHGLDTGQMATDAALAKFKKMLDDAGRQTFKDKIQKQLDAYIAAHK